MFIPPATVDHLLTVSVSLLRKLIGKLLLETAVEHIEINSGIYGLSLATLPMIRIQPVSRRSFTSRQCLCTRGPRCGSAVL